MIRLRTLFTLGFMLFALTVQAAKLPAPEKDEMSISELNAKLYDFDEKIIETEITSASSFEQIASGKYRAYCYYYKGASSSVSGESVLIPEEGKEFFEELSKKDFWNSSSKTVYLRVHSKKPLRVKGSHSYKLEAVGTKYRKSKGEYSW